MKLLKRGKDDWLFLPEKARQRSHTEVLGETQKGKSKFLTHMLWQDILDGNGLCLIDWHGTLYREVLRKIADGKPYGRTEDVILLNPSAPDFITGFNPFMNRGRDVSVQVNRRIATTLKPWGGDLDEMPTFERTAGLVFNFSVQYGEPLPIAELLIRRNSKKLRAWLVKELTDSRLKSEWERLDGLSSASWEKDVMSFQNRLNRFVSSTAIKRFMGLKTGNLDIQEIMDGKKILLVNLGFSEMLDREAARVFASLLVSEFFECAMRRANRNERPENFYLYCDEFGQYATDEVGDVLNQCLKGGLHFILSHQDFQQLDSEKLESAIFGAARHKVVFGGMRYDAAVRLANELFLGDVEIAPGVVKPGINSRDVKETYTTLFTWLKEATREVQGSGVRWGDSEGQVMVDEPFSTESSSSGEGYYCTTIPWEEKRQEERVSGRAEWSREEKVSRFAEILKELPTGHCVVKLDLPKEAERRTKFLKSPFTPDPTISEEEVRAFELECYEKQGAIPASEADRLLQEQETEFLKRIAGSEKEESFGVKKRRTAEPARIAKTPPLS